MVGPSSTADGLKSLLHLVSDGKVRIAVPDVEVRLQDVGDGLVGHTPAEGEAFAFQEGDVLVEHGLAELIEQAGLAHPRLGDDGDRLAPSLPGTLEGVEQATPAPVLCRRRASGPARRSHQTGYGWCWGQSPGRPRWASAFPLISFFAQTLKAKKSFGEFEGFGGNIGGAGLGQAFHPGGQVHRIAHDLEIDPQVITQGPDHHRSRVDPNPHPQGRDGLAFFLELFIEPSHLPVDGQGRADGPLRGIFQGNGRSEEPDDAITGHLVDRSFEVMDLMDEDLEDPVHKAVSLFRAELLGKGRIPGQIAEQDRDLSPLPLDPVPLGEDLFGQTRGEITLQLGDGVNRRRGFGGRGMDG